ncbi:MAG: NfeD family protein [Gammaproteobacteria bacterium]|nr:MAG: NfeD family protein [Gammaproteobacteria bacterium]RKZ96371.1 MAG: NfeD family protein [Gammaproteobacteria bacterium]RKZ97066.1 MAG: NfeD family protein [Gammaproteobacteria bacterium]
MEVVMDFWHWWIIAVVLVIIEILAPTFFALWMAIAAFLTGVALFLMPEMQWEYQVFLFATLSVISIVVWRHYYSKNPIATDEPLLNRRGEQYIGRVITLKEPIIDGQGKVQVDDSTWKIEGKDCPSGTKIKVVSVNNVLFQVEHV